jgi:hypothetical protein
MWYIYHLMNKVKPEVIFLRRKARCVLPMPCVHVCISKEDGRQIKLERLSSPLNSSGNGHTRDPSYTTTVENISESEIPLASHLMPMGYSASPTHFHPEEPLEHYDTYLHAPKPQRPGRQINPEEGLRSTPNLTIDTNDPFADSHSPPPLQHTRPPPTKNYTTTRTFSTSVGSQEPASEFTPAPRYTSSQNESTKNSPPATTTHSPYLVQQGPHDTGYATSPEPISEK